MVTAWATNVTCQRFFTYNSDFIYFEVSNPVSGAINTGTRGSEDPENGTGSGNNGNGSGSEPSETLAIFDRRLLVNLRKYEERAVTITEPGFLNASVWLNRTG